MHLYKSEVFALAINDKTEPTFTSNAILINYVKAKLINKNKTHQKVDC
jgi:hypothetical protein